jgi:hypothetical protein
MFFTNIVFLFVSFLQGIKKETLIIKGLCFCHVSQFHNVFPLVWSLSLRSGLFVSQIRPTSLRAATRNLLIAAGKISALQK